MRKLVLILTLAAATPVFAQTVSPSYRITHTYTLGGNGGWEHIVLDPSTHRVFIGRQDRVMVIDENTGTLVGEVTDVRGARGTAIASTSGHGFATAGDDATVVMFDLSTLKTLRRIPAAAGVDDIVYDEASNRVFTFNAEARSSTVIDPRDGSVVATIRFGGKPASGVSAGNGRIYANLTDRNEIVEIDATRAAIVRWWSTDRCQQPTTLSIDTTNQRLFSGCSNGLMAVSDYQTGAVVATVPIGAGVNGSGFDAWTGNAFASASDGTLTVIHQDLPDRYRVVQTVRTPLGASMALDPATHRLFVASARLETTPAGAEDAIGQLVPDSLNLMVIEHARRVR